MAFALLSEIEFTEEYVNCITFGRTLHDMPHDPPAPHIEEWHQQMATFLKSIDPNRHLVSTHFSHPGRGESVLKVPAVDIATSNAYSAFDEFELQGSNSRHPLYDASMAVHDFWTGNERVKGFMRFKKPALIEEQGRHWMGVEDGHEWNTKAQLDADLHAGLWGSAMVPLSGATGYWWWLHVHLDNRYGDYRALANYLAGEDFRPQPGEAPLEPGVRTVGEVRSDRRVYAWIVHPDTPLGKADIETISGAPLKVGNLLPGTYAVEFWDTYKGVVIERQNAEVTAAAKQLLIKLPPVYRDMALKVKLTTPAK
jgi:hypothetical protein